MKRRVGADMDWTIRYRLRRNEGLLYESPCHASGIRRSGITFRRAGHGVCSVPHSRSPSGAAPRAMTSFPSSMRVRKDVIENRTTTYTIPDPCKNVQYGSQVDYVPKADRLPCTLRTGVRTNFPAGSAYRRDGRLKGRVRNFGARVPFGMDSTVKYRYNGTT